MIKGCQREAVIIHRCNPYIIGNLTYLKWWVYSDVNGNFFSFYNKDKHLDSNYMCGIENSLFGLKITCVAWRFKQFEHERTKWRS